MPGAGTSSGPDAPAYRARVDDHLLRMSEDLRRRGSLKWTAVDAPLAAWVAESDLGTAPAVTDALVGAARRGLTGYLPPAVRAELGAATAQWHARRYGWDVRPPWVHPVADVLEALRLTIDIYTPPGSPVVVPTPAYMPFLTAPVAWGREVVQVPMTDDDGRRGLDLDAVAAALRAGAHLVVLVNPHNPTGRVMAADELAALGRVVARHGGRVFADEVHAPLTMPGHRHVPYASVDAVTAGHAVTATSASKAWNVPGLKCAQVILSSEEDAARWAPHDHLATHGASTPGAVVNAAAYREGGPWLDGLVARLADHRGALADGLRSAGVELEADGSPVRYRAPEGTYLAWLDLRPWLAGLAEPPTDLARWLRAEAGVAVVDGAACGVAGRGHVRVNLAMPRPLVVEAGRRLASALLAHTAVDRPRA